MLTLDDDDGVSKYVFSSFEAFLESALSYAVANLNETTFNQWAYKISIYREGDLIILVTDPSHYLYLTIFDIDETVFGTVVDEEYVKPLITCLRCLFFYHINRPFNIYITIKNNKLYLSFYPTSGYFNINSIAYNLSYYRFFINKCNLVTCLPGICKNNFYNGYYEYRWASGNPSFVYSHPSIHIPIKMLA
jgi:hypothetical protein